MSKFRPTKAEDVVNPEDLKFPLVAMTKYDGVYALVREGVLLGRSLKPIPNNNISSILSSPKYEGFVGELCYGRELNVQELCRVTTSHTGSHNKEWEEGFSWPLFDYTHPEVIGMPYLERLQALSEVVKGLADPSVWVAPYAILTSPQEVTELYEANLDQGYEGVILRQPDGSWKNGRSTLKQQLFLRMKPSGDSEAVIVGVQEAMENNNEAKTNELGYTERSSHQENKVGKGMVGAFLCIDLVSGMVIKVGAGKLTHLEREEYFKNPPIGQLTKYRSLLTGVKDAPRHARHINFRNPSDLDDELYLKYIRIIKELKL